MQHRAQVAQRPEDFRPGHQHDEKRGKAHLALRDTPGGERNDGRSTDCSTEIGDRAGEKAGGKHPEGVVGERTGTGGKVRGEGAALPEGLEGGQALHGIEEFFAEGFERGSTGKVGAALTHVHRHGADESGECAAEQDGGNRQVPVRSKREDREGSGDGNGKLRQIMTESGLDLFDPVDEREHHAARAAG